MTWLHFISLNFILKCSSRPKWVNCSGHYVQLVTIESINLHEKFHSINSILYSSVFNMFLFITCYIEYGLRFISIKIVGPSAIFKLRRLIKHIKTHRPKCRHAHKHKQTVKCILSVHGIHTGREKATKSHHFNIVICELSMVSLLSLLWRSQLLINSTKISLSKQPLYHFSHE